MTGIVTCCSDRTKSAIQHRDTVTDTVSTTALETGARIAIEASEKLAQEECALRQGIAELDAVYNELDLAIGTVCRRSAAGGAS